MSIRISTEQMERYALRGGMEKLLNLKGPPNSVRLFLTRKQLSHLIQDPLYTTETEWGNLEQTRLNNEPLQAGKWLGIKIYLLK